MIDATVQPLMLHSAMIARLDEFATYDGKRVMTRAAAIRFLLLTAMRQWDAGADFDSVLWRLP